MPPETSPEFIELKRQVNDIYEAMIGNEYNEGFIERFNKYCDKVRKLEIEVACLTAALVAAGVKILIT